MRKGSFWKNHPFSYNKEVQAGPAKVIEPTFPQLTPYNNLFVKVNAEYYSVKYGYKIPIQWRDKR
jgi:hypothetical protein